MLTIRTRLCVPPVVASVTHLLLSRSVSEVWALPWCAPPSGKGGAGPSAAPEVRMGVFAGGGGIASPLLHTHSFLLVHVTCVQSESTRRN